MYELRAKSAKETDILMYGSISEWGRVRAEDLFLKLSDAKAKGYESVNLKINSPGGSIFEGIAIMSQMQMKDLYIVGIVEGLAASMASAMLQGCHRRKMVKGGRMMIHQGAGGVYGSANYIRDYADLLDSLNKTLSEIYAKRTKKDAKWILDNWMAEGKDTWFTAEQALKEGLIDEIVEGKVKPLEKETATLIEMAAHYASQLDTTETEMNKTELIALLGLKADATDAEIKAALSAMKAKADAAKSNKDEEEEEEEEDDDDAEKSKKKDKSKANANVEAVTLFAKAKGVTDKKLLASIEKVAAIDLLAALSLIPENSEKKTEEKEKPEKALSINDLVAAIKGSGSDGKGTGSDNSDRKNWDLKAWQEKDSKGLLAMIREKPEQYQKLFQAAHGYTPSLEELKSLTA